ncbi:MAG: hypothetical protein K0S47_1584 [Herbinix sp.]|jgi:hypothetical protein|nr:hypothetical protein [Herbinix sp.]
MLDPETTTRSSLHQVPDTTFKTSKKSKYSHKRSFLLFLILFLILSAGITAYGFSPTLANSFALATKTPAEYYRYVEEMALTKSIDQLSEAYNSKFFAGKEPQAYQLTSELTFDRPTVLALLKSYTDVNPEEFEANLGISLQSFQADILAAKSGSNTKSSLSLGINRKSLVSLEMYTLNLMEELFLRSPEISPSFLKITSAVLGLDNPTEHLEAAPTTEEVTNFLSRYRDLYLNRTSNVTMEKNYSLTVGELTDKTTKLTLSFSEKEQYDFLTAILTEAKKDPLLLKLLPSLSITKEDYVSTIERSILYLDSVYPSPSEDIALQIIINVDHRGNIIGREVKRFGSDLLEDTPSTFGYMITRNLNHAALDVYVANQEGKKLIHFVGSITYKNGFYDGMGNLVIAPIAATTLQSGYSFDIQFNNVASTVVEGQDFYQGSIRITSPSFMGTEVLFELMDDNNLQQSVFKLQMGNASLITLTSSLEKLKDYSFTIPADTEQSYEWNELDEYLAAIHTEEVFTTLSEKLGSEKLMDLLPWFNAN